MDKHIRYDYDSVEKTDVALSDDREISIRLNFDQTQHLVDGNSLTIRKEGQPVISIHLADA